MPQRLTKEEFIRRSIMTHGNKYDYSKAIYKNITTKVCIICPVHGEFWQIPSDHMVGRGCQRCYGNQKMTTDEFVEKAKKVHGDKYDYSKVEYDGNKIKVCVICHEHGKHGEEHGEFWQKPNDHLVGYGCPICGNSVRKTTEEFVESAMLVHGGRYDYSKVDYQKAHSKVCIICPIHGEFWQQPCNHLRGANCPYCNCSNKSKMESVIRDKMLEHKLQFEQQKTFDWLKYERNLFLDFYCDKYKIAIEVQGDQHFVPIERYGGYADFELRQKRDKVKKQLCEEHGIKVFYITKKNYSLDEVLKYINETGQQKESKC